MKKLTAILLALMILLCGCDMGGPQESPASEHRELTAEYTTEATTGAADETVTQTAIPEDGEILTVHYIDVGQADSILIEYGSFAMLIDGGNKEDGSLVVSYLEQQGVEQLNAVVCTHAHEDHVGGLPSVLAVYPTEAVYAPTRTYSSKIFDDFVYYTDQQGLDITIPSPGDTLTWSEGGMELVITVMGPVESYADPNNTSIILLMEFGSTRFLFTGDMETAAENDMLDYWGDRVDWQVDVLKVGHHGSDTSTGYRFLNEVMPAYGVIPVGEGNSYGHPCEEPLSRLTQAGVALFRTDELGHVIATSDGTTVTLTWQDQTAEPGNVEPGEAVEATFIGNKNSKKFHAETCGSLPKAENQVIFSSYDEALQAGYTPCSSCLG